jgi:hypothetical protein
MLAELVCSLAVVGLCRYCRFLVACGLGSKVQIHWPSGVDQVLKNVRADQIVKIDEPAAAKWSSVN